MKTKYVIFDLDDTLIYEIDFLKSAYREIASTLDNTKDIYGDMIYRFNNGQNVFEYLVQKYPGWTKNQLLDIYRNHVPQLFLDKEIEEFILILKSKGYKLGLITDGRSITQRNKLRALNIEHFFDKIVISEEFGSEKPDERNFKFFLDDLIKDYFYIADNPKKDFITPNKLGWKSICLLDKGHNIHKQNFDVNPQYQPQYKVWNFKEALKFIL